MCIAASTHMRVHVSYKGWNFWMAVEKIFMESRDGHDTRPIILDSVPVEIQRWPRISYDIKFWTRFDRMIRPHHHLGLARRRRVLPHFLPRPFRHEINPRYVHHPFNFLDGKIITVVRLGEWEGIFGLNFLIKFRISFLSFFFFTIVTFNFFILVKCAIQDLPFNLFKY